MKKINEFIVNNSKAIIIVSVIFMIIGAIMSTKVSINLDNTSYLPDYMNSKEALEKLREDFNMMGMANLMIKDKEPDEIVEIREKISNVPGVDEVIWLDTMPTIPGLETVMESVYKEQFYKDGNALLQIIFTNIDESRETQEALEEIENIVGEKGHISGLSAISRNTINRTNSEIPIYSIVAVILISIILLMATSSWIEPLLFFFTIGVAILINMGLNAISGEVSQVTFAAANLLQLAVSMDYMIFLLHRFHEEREKGIEVKEAVINSLSLSKRAIIASAVTTIAGFIALTFMDFGIGKDIGYVLARGVLITLVTVMTVLPALITVFHKYIEKFSHKEINPKFNLFSKIAIKGRYVMAMLLVVSAGIFVMAQSNIEYYYANENMLPKDDKAIVDMEEIEKVYGYQNPCTIIVPTGDKEREVRMVEEISGLPYVTGIMSLYSMIGELPETLIPQEIKDKFTTDEYSMILFNLTNGKDTKEAFEGVDEVREIVSDYYEESYIAGEPFSYRDLKDVTDKDFKKATILSLIFIFIIMMIAFKSISIPLIAVFIIQSAIWINVGLAYFMGSSMSFISFVVIGAIQLGATVDYAILYIGRYKEYLEEMSPIEAAKSAIKSSAKSIITSASILSVATFSIYFIASITTASELCLLIGRGALVSLISVLFVLPGMLIIFNPIIRISSLKWPGSRVGK